MSVSLPYPEPGFAHPWRDAADKLAAASDLLATHVGPHGERLSEHADAVLNPRNRRIALMQIADVTSAVLPIELPLGSACRQAGVAWLTVHNWLPDLNDLQPLVEHMRGRWDRWYREAIPLADDRFDRHLDSTRRKNDGTKP